MLNPFNLPFSPKGQTDRWSCLRHHRLGPFIIVKISQSYINNHVLHFSENSMGIWTVNQSKVFFLGWSVMCLYFVKTSPTCSSSGFYSTLKHTLPPRFFFSFLFWINRSQVRKSNQSLFIHGFTYMPGPGSTFFENNRIRAFQWLGYSIL